MKTQRIGQGAPLRTLLFLGLGFSAVSGCGSDEKDGKGKDPDEILACDTLPYCSSWWVFGSKVDALPEATGGTIVDGEYVLADVLSVETSFDAALREALVIDGDRYYSTVSGLSTGSGTWSTDGNRITFTEVQSCGYTGDDLGPSSEPPRTFDYTVDGDVLIVFNEENYSYQYEPIRAGLLFTRPADLCEPGGTATCTIEECFCAHTTDGQLSDEECGG